ncbi:TMV resistance protein N-like protein [Tanacetum coccineum]
MASSSNSSADKSYKYDVFLSFRGEDTRNNFVGHLYHALKQEGIETYMDDERIEKGKTINNQLIKSVEHSRFFIVVFSKNYASSTWCLDELVKIMECQKTSKQTAYPIFFDVEPTEVRKQSGDFGKAFAKHINKEAAGNWIEAMKEASDLAGWELKATANGDESELIKKVVDDIFKKLCAISLSVDENLVGMETRIKDVLALLEICSNDNVRMIGIKGMGGSGKTTLARAVYDQISFQFEGTSFVENVREFSKPSLSGLKKLQKQILTDVFNNPNMPVSSVSDGKKVMIQMMRRKKVLVVLDDVDNVGPFLLTDKEAVCLFSRYAFGKETPIHGYEEMSGQVVSYADGLPLTIRVLGSFLCDKNEPEWKDALKRLKRIPLKETLEILELSYNSLEDDYKEIFLDISCILKGERKDKAIRVLESCGFHASIGLRVLEQKSLITVSRHGDLGMHDQIEEMGKNIVCRLHPNEPNKHSRLRIDEKNEDIFANDLGNEAIRCIKLLPSEINFENVMRFLRDMKKLRVLYMCSGSNWNDIKVSQNFPDSLRYLCWRAYPFSHLPETFQAHNLVGLDMSFSSIEQLWEDGKEKVLNKLRFLDLSYTPLIKLNLKHTLNLEILNLEQTDLIELDIPYGCRKLQSINLNNSKVCNLTLTGLTPDLETLSLQGCDLNELYMPFQCPKLRSLGLNGSKLRTFNLGLTSDLETLSLDLSGSDLEELHMPDECPNLKSLSFDNSKLKKLVLGQTPNLETLSIGGCCDLVEIQMPDECPKLKSLSLCNSKLRTVDLGRTPNLERLDLKNSYDLVDINAPVGCLKKIVYLDLSGCRRFNSFSFKKELQSLDVGSFSELHLRGESIDLCPLHPESNLPKWRFTCLYKEHQPSSFGNLERLISMGLCACTKLESFSRSISGLQFLRKLTLEHDIPDLTKDLNQLQYLEELQLSHASIKHLPDSLCMLKHLKSLKIKICQNLEKLPDEFGQLESLEEFSFSHAKIKHLPDSVCMLKQLKSLKLNVCQNFEKLPDDFGQLESLEELFLSHAKIKHLPDSVCMLKNLKSLKLSVCQHLEKLTENFGQLESLEELSLSHAKIKHLPDSLCMLENLKSMELRSCEHLEKLPEDFGQLRSLRKLHLDTKAKHLPVSIYMLKHLKSLEIGSYYKTLNKLPEDLGRLQCIEALNLSRIEMRHLPDSLCMLKHLKSLELKTCWRLKKLPEDLGQLEFLEKLDLTNCSSLLDIPESVCEIKHLKYLNLSGCQCVEILPEELGRLKSLKELNITFTNIHYLPQSIFGINCLRIVGNRSFCIQHQLTGPKDLPLFKYSIPGMFRRMLGEGLRLDSQYSLTQHLKGQDLLWCRAPLLVASEYTSALLFFVNYAMLLCSFDIGLLALPPSGDDPSGLA